MNEEVKTREFKLFDETLGFEYCFRIPEAEVQAMPLAELANKYFALVLKTAIEQARNPVNENEGVIQ